MGSPFAGTDLDSVFAQPPEAGLRASSAKGMNPPAGDLSVLLADAHTKIRASHRSGQATAPLPSIEVTNTTRSEGIVTSCHGLG